MCALQVDSGGCDSRQKMAEQLALAAGFGAACIGILSCSKRDLVDIWVGHDKIDTDLTRARVIDIVSRALATSLALAQPDPAVKPKPEADDAETWLWSSSYLIGIGERIGDLAPVTALVSDKPRQRISVEQQSLANIGLTYAEQLLQERLGITGRDGGNRIPEIILRNLSFGFAVTDADGTLNYMTSLAEDWLENSKELNIINGRLTAVTPQNKQLLLDALASATGRRERASVVHLGGPEDQPRTIVVLPISRSPTLALVIFGQAQGNAVLCERLLKALGLTVAERRLAQQLLDGKSLADAAAENNLTIATARSYLKRVFAKTGVHRQSQLISLYHTLIPPLLTDSER